MTWLWNRGWIGLSVLLWVTGTITIGLAVAGGASPYILAIASPSLILVGLVLIIVLTAELSLIVANGKNYLDNAWWISTLPGLGIGFVVIAIGLTGDWMRRVLARGGFEVN